MLDSTLEMLVREAASADFCFLAQRVLEETAATGVAIALDAGGGEIVCCGRAGQTAPELGVRLQRNSGITGQCVALGQIVNCHEAQSDERVNAAACRALGVASIAAVPIRYEHTVIGVLEALSDRPFAFAANEIAVLEKYAAQVVHDAFGTSPHTFGPSLVLRDAEPHEGRLSEEAISELVEREFSHSHSSDPERPAAGLVIVHTRPESVDENLRAIAQDSEPVPEVVPGAHSEVPKVAVTLEEAKSDTSEEESKVPVSEILEADVPESASVYEVPPPATSRASRLAVAASALAALAACLFIYSEMARSAPTKSVAVSAAPAVPANAENPANLNRLLALSESRPSATSSSTTAVSANALATNAPPSTTTPAPRRTASIEHLRSQADQGNANAQFQLANTYVTGDGVRKDPVQAYAWYIAAQSHGSREADQALANFSPKLNDEQLGRVRLLVGQMYWHGNGVPQDRTAAYTWLSLAQANGNPDAEAQKQQLASEMSAAEVLEGTNRANDWLERHRHNQAR